MTDTQILARSPATDEPPAPLEKPPADDPATSQDTGQRRTPIPREMVFRALI